MELNLILCGQKHAKVNVSLDVRWGYSTQNEELFRVDTTREEKNGRKFFNVAADTHQKEALWMKKKLF